MLIETNALPLSQATTHIWRPVRDSVFCYLPVKFNDTVDVHELLFSKSSCLENIKCLKGKVEIAFLCTDKRQSVQTIAQENSACITDISEILAPSRDLY